MTFERGGTGGLVAAQDSEFPSADREQSRDGRWARCSGGSTPGERETVEPSEIPAAGAGSPWFPRANNSRKLLK